MPAGLHPKSFPGGSILGVVGGSSMPGARELLDLKLRGLGGLEIRADLFTDPRKALERLREVPPELPAVFTLRIEGEGGKFHGEERERLEVFEAALSAGAAGIDAEWGTGAAHELVRRGAPLIISHHDFRGMPAPDTLERLTSETASLSLLGIKAVPTARTLSDGVSVLEWIERRSPGMPARIAFAMGEAGFPSRILSIARGSPITYASLGAPVAPGQASVGELLSLYRPQTRTRATRVLGVAGNPVGHSLSPHIHNPALLARGIDAVYLPFLLERLEEILPALDPLGIDGLSVTIPFKEEALRLARHADARSRAAGAANTLKVDRGKDGRWTALRAFNTDVEGVLGPLKRRVGDLMGMTAAVIGNGGAARGAVRALLEGGASPTLYYRNPARGGPVAGSLGVPGRRLEDLRPGAHRVILNATSLGLKAGDASPVSPAVFKRETIAFEMVYDPPDTRFLLDARSGGATAIPGREMLVAQAVEQFRIFTGLEASLEELDENFQRGLALRRAAP